MVGASEHFSAAVEPSLTQDGYATIAVMVTKGDGTSEFLDAPRWATVFDPANASRVASILNGEAPADLTLHWSHGAMSYHLFPPGEITPTTPPIASLDSVAATSHYEELQAREPAIPASAATKKTPGM